MGAGQRKDHSFLEALRAHGEQRPDQCAVTHLVDGEDDAHDLTYAELDRHARRIALAIREHKAEGEPVVVFCPAGLDYVGMFLGCVYAGAIAVPVPPPDPANLPLSFYFLRSVVGMVGARVVLCPGPIYAMAGSLVERAPGMTGVRWITTGIAEGKDEDAAYASPSRQPDDVICLQLTSGTTRPARAVPVTGAGLCAVLTSLAETLRCEGEIVSVSAELPSHHRGLFWGVLLPLFLGGRAVLMSPAQATSRPFRWLEAISKYGATVSGATHTLYALTLEDLRANPLRPLNLSTWRTAWVAGEPIGTRTLDAFAAALEQRGPQVPSFVPVYDLAEASSVVAASMDAHRITVADHDLRTGHVVERAATGPHRVLLSVGKGIAGNRVCCVAPESLSECPAGEVGEIWCQGPTVAAGYWNQSSESGEDFSAYLADGSGPYLRTGDAGFARQGRIYLLGRLASQIVLDRSQYHAHEIERVVETSHVRTRIGTGAAFACEIAGQRRLVVVKEVERRRLERRNEQGVKAGDDDHERRVGAEDRRMVDLAPNATAVDPGRELNVEEVIGAIQEAVSNHCDLGLHAVVLVKVGSLPRAPTGVTQRHTVRSHFETGTLTVVGQWHDTLLPLDGAGEMPQEALTQSFLPHVRLQVAKALNQAQPENLDTRAPLAQLGLTSITAVVLDVAMAELLGTDLGRDIELPRAIAFQHPTIEALSGYIAHLVHALKRGVPTTAIETTQPTSQPHAINEPIAIVGMALRLPGDVDTPAALWSLLRSGADVVRDIPAKRWDVGHYYDPDPDAAGKMYVRRGAFVDDVDAFDAPFFAISPQEARSMDPQQRLLAEVTWQALEGAGQRPAQLNGCRAGVFVGLSYVDYAILADFAAHPQQITAHSITGNSPSIAAGRLCHLFGLKGPALVVDTACSSGLVALHLSIQSLRNAECSLAVVGGANLILSPHTTLGLSRMHALAPDGYCKTFDAAADGFARSEGCVVFVLKRLSDAIEQADEVLAVIRSTAINHDGRSTSLSAPNGVSQQAVIRQAWEAARLAPDAVDYVEAHGTGTSLGDPVELESLGAAIGQRDEARRLAVGSVKTNIGHLEPAAGLAGLAKVVVALEHEQLPEHRRLRSVNPHIALAKLPMSITGSPTAWPRGDRPRTVGLSAFGFSGTNAHVVLQEAPDRAMERPPMDRPVHVLCLSGKSADTLQEHAQQTAAHLRENPQQDVRDVCFTANATRSHFTHRLAVIGGTTEQICQQLEASQRSPGTVAMSTPDRGSPPKIALLFSEAIAASWAGIGRAFFAQQGAFRGTVKCCAKALGSESGLRLEQAVVEGRLPVAESERAAVLYATQMGLYEAFRCWGLRPQAMAGFGAGEVAAACAAGMLNLEAGLELTQQRVAAGKSIAAAPHDTAMASSRGILQPLLVSGMTGQAIDGSAMDGNYWTRQASEPFQVAPTIETLHGQVGATLFLEIGSHGALLGLVRRLAPQTRGVPSLRRGRSSWHALSEALAQLYVAGLDLDWSAYDAPYVRSKVSLPTHPFRRRRYWLPVANPWQGSAPSSSRHNPHPLLGPPVRPADSDGDQVVCELSVSPEQPAYLGDHRVHGEIVVPGTAHLEAALAAAWHGFEWRAYALEDVDVERPLVLTPGKHKRMQVVLRKTASRPTFAIYSRPETPSGSPWECHVRGHLAQIAEQAHDHLDFNQVRARCSTPVDLHEFDQRVAGLGLGYGPTFRCVQEAWLGEGEVFGRVGLADGVGGDAEQHFVHPGLLDCCLQFWGAMAQAQLGKGPFVPVAVERYTCSRRGHQQLWCHMVFRSGDASADGITVDIGLFDNGGGAVGKLQNLHLRRLPADSVRRQASTEIERLVHRIEWSPTQTAEPPATVQAEGAWLILSDGTGLGSALAAQLEQAGGGTCTVVGLPTQCDLDGLQRAVKQALASVPEGLRGIAYLWSMDATAPAQTSTETLNRDALTELGGALALVQILEQAAERPQVFFVTRGAHAVGEQKAPVEIAQALMWGFARTVANELPELNCRLVDLDPDTAVEKQARRLLDQMFSSTPNAQVAIRGDHGYVPRLKPSTMKRAEEPQADVQIRPTGAYVITGGLGAMGLETAKWLVARGARSLVLVGRRGATTPAHLELVAQLEDAGARVVIRQADVSSADDVASMFADLAAQTIEVNGIVHAAGVLDDGVVGKQSWERFARVLAPKMAGAWNLHHATRDIPLDFFISFSSVASILGLEGQSNYATANAFLDALAQLRSRQGLAGSSLNWGPVADIGMASAVDTRLGRQRWESMGISMLEVTQLGAVLDRVLNPGAAQLAIVELDKGRLATNRGQWALVDPQIESQPDRREVSAVVESLNRAHPSVQLELLLEHVRGAAADLLGISEPAEIGAETPFQDIGVDSLLAVDLRNRLRKDLDVRLPATLVFDYPTVAAVTDFLAEALQLHLAVQPEQHDPQGDPEGDSSRLASDLQEMSDQAAEAALDDLLDALGADEAQGPM